MAESGHSPGPWEWYGPTRGEGITFTHEAHVGPGEGNDICGPIACVGGDDDEQAVANARLISSAPDMATGIRAAVAAMRAGDEVESMRAMVALEKLLDTLPAEQPREGGVS